MCEWSWSPFIYHRNVFTLNQYYYYIQQWHMYASTQCVVNKAKVLIAVSNLTLTNAPLQVLQQFIKHIRAGCFIILRVNIEDCKLHVIITIEIFVTSVWCWRWRSRWKLSLSRLRSVKYTTNRKDRVNALSSGTTDRTTNCREQHALLLFIQPMNSHNIFHK